MKTLARAGAVALSVGGVVACAPALDWRDVQAAGVPLQWQFPCKPASQRRSVALAGTPVPMTLFACDAAGQTFALAAADVTDPARVGGALDALVAAAAGNLQATPTAGAPLRPRGATPHAAGRSHVLQGRRPDGRPARMALAVFAYGTTVFQATVVGESLDEDAVAVFMASLRAGS